MVVQRTWVFALSCAFSLAGVVGCTSDSGDGGGSGGAGSSSAASGGGTLRWYTTCGDPVCGGHRDDPAVPPCTVEAEGVPCGTANASCDLGNDCNSHLLCTASDPTEAPGGCPKSRARFKHDIRYLEGAELERVRDDLVRMPLASWQYNHEGDNGPQHLGFIIDDNPSSPAVAPDGDHVDVYGYASMAVAALQVQQKQIAALERQVEELRRALDEKGVAGKKRPAAKAK